MQYFEYLKYLPFLIQLITFIRDAEKNYPTKGSGAEKLAYVTGEFTPVIKAAAGAGLINQRVADEIVKDVPAIVSLVVQLLNSVGALKGAAEQPVQVPRTAGAA